MTYYRFVSSDGKRRALTVDKRGVRLPAFQGQWNFLGPMDLSRDDPRIGVTVADIAAGVEQDGYFILPDSHRPHPA